MFHIRLGKILKQVSFAGQEKKVKTDKVILCEQLLSALDSFFKCKVQKDN